MDPSRVGKATARRLSIVSPARCRWGSARPSARSFVGPPTRSPANRRAGRARASPDGEGPRTCPATRRPGTVGSARRATARSPRIPTQIANATTASNRDRPSAAAPSATANASSAHAGPASRSAAAAATAGPANIRRRVGRPIPTAHRQAWRTGGDDGVAAPMENCQCDAHGDGEPAQPQPGRDGALGCPSERHRPRRVRRREAPAVETAVDERRAVPEVVAIDGGDPSVVQSLAEHDPAAVWTRCDADGP